MTTTTAQRVIAGGYTKETLLRRVRVLYGEQLTDRAARHLAAALVLRFWAQDEANAEKYRREAPTKSAWVFVQMCGLENECHRGLFN